MVAEDLVCLGVSGKRPVVGKLRKFEFDGKILILNTMMLHYCCP